MSLLLGGGDDDSDDDDYDGEPALPFTKANHNPDVAFLKRVFDWGAYARDPCGDGDQVPLGHLSPDDLVRAGTLVADDVNALTAANKVGDVSGWPRIFASATMLGADALEDALDSNSPELINQRLSIARITPLMAAVAMWGSMIPKLNAEGQQIFMERGKATVSTLLEAGADVTAKDIMGNNVLMFCMRHEWTAYGPACVIPHLIAKGLDVDARNRLGQNPICQTQSMDRGTAWIATLVQAGTEVGLAFATLFMSTDGEGRALHVKLAELVPLAGLTAGDRVMVRDAAVGTHKLARVQPPSDGHPHALGRYPVVVDGTDRVISVNMCDMRRPGLRDCPQCGTPDAPSRCSRCKVAAYCGRECQVAHYKEHKVACKEAATALEGRGTLIPGAVGTRMIPHPSAEIVARQEHPPGELFTIKVVTKTAEEIHTDGQSTAGGSPRAVLSRWKA